MARRSLPFFPFFYSRNWACCVGPLPGDSCHVLRREVTMKMVDTVTESINSGLWSGAMSSGQNIGVSQFQVQEPN